MTLNINNKPTEKQWEMLRQLEYFGSPHITKQDASVLIDELLEQDRIALPRNVKDYRKLFKRING